MKGIDPQRYRPFADAVRTWHEALEAGGCPDRMPSELVGLADAVGRVPAQIARTKYPCPTYRAAAMDGYAVRSDDVARASTEEPVRLPIGVAAIQIDTGGAMPDGFDAVVPFERVCASGDDVEVARSVAPGKNVRLPGDDVPPGVAIGWPGTMLRAIDCAALVSSGCTSVEVVKRPCLAIIPTGDEIVPPGSPPKAGTVIESNTLMLASQARGLGADVVVWPIVKDDEAALDTALRSAIESADIVAMLAGSSAGRRDRCAGAIARIGTIDVRGVATRPGRPVVLGHAGSVPIVNLPGYPASCHFAFEAYVAPLLRRLAGLYDQMPRRARLAQAVETDGLCDEWHVASLLTAPGSPRALVVPFADVGGSVYQLAQADARFALKRGIAGYGRFACVQWTPLRDHDGAARALFTGPYDPLIEEMAALGGFRCRWTDDESGEALDAGLADAVGVVLRGGNLSSLRKRAGEARKMLTVGLRAEGRCFSREGASDRCKPGISFGDPWEGAASVASGVLQSAPCTRYVAECFGLRFDEREPALYAVVWEDRPGHRFPWGIVLAAAMSALTDAAPALGWKSIGQPAEVIT